MQQKYEPERIVPVIPVLEDTTKGNTEIDFEIINCNPSKSFSFLFIHAMIAY